MPGQVLDDAKEDVSVQAALVSLIQDDHRVLVELAVLQTLPQKGAICRVMQVCQHLQALLAGLRRKQQLGSRFVNSQANRDGVALSLTLQMEGYAVQKGGSREVQNL